MLKGDGETGGIHVKALFEKLKGQALESGASQVLI